MPSGRVPAQCTGGHVFVLCQVMPVMPSNVTMVSGGFKGVQGATAPGPALLVTQKGPCTQEKIEKKSQENI